MSVYKRPGKTIYSYDFKYRGQRFSGSTGCSTKREAKKWEDDERKRVAISPIELNSPMTMLQASAKYWAEKSKKISNVYMLEQNLNWLVNEIGEDVPITTITEETVASLILKGSKLQPRSERCLQTLQSIVVLPNRYARS